MTLEERVAQLEAIVGALLPESGDMFVGDNPGDHSANHSEGEVPPQDFWFDLVHHRLHVRTLLVREDGDTPEIAFARKEAGATPADTTVALIHASGFGEDAVEYRAAQTYIKTTQETTHAGGTGGKHVIATTPKGGTAPIDRHTVNDDGRVDITSDDAFEGFLMSLTATRGSASQKGLKVDVRNNGAANVILQISRDGNKLLEIRGDGKMAVFGATPVGRAPAISPTGIIAVDQIINALKNFGIIA